MGKVRPPSFDKARSDLAKRGAKGADLRKGERNALEAKKRRSAAANEAGEELSNIPGGFAAQQWAAMFLIVLLVGSSIVQFWVAAVAESQTNVRVESED